MGHTRHARHVDRLLQTPPLRSADRTVAARVRLLARPGVARRQWRGGEGELMCGICGVWGGDSRKEVRAMVQALDHRGPDDRGVFEEKNVVLGMTRLAIIDTGSGGHQPMLSPDGQIAIIYNGELYNFRAERALLEKLGHSFRSTSDTEVVLRMYEHYGDDFLLRLRGMFALAIYDKRNGPGHERLLLARDQLGIKPLLYTTVQGRFVFASEIKALLASGLVAPEIDPVALRLLLTHGAIVQL